MPQAVGAQHRRPDPGEVVVARAVRHVGAAAQRERAAAGEGQRVEQALEQQRRAPGGADLHQVLAGGDLPGREGELARAHLRALAVAAADRLGAADAGQVLGPQPGGFRFARSRADPERAAGDQRQRERRAEDSPSPLAFASVELHRCVVALQARRTLADTARLLSRALWPSRSSLLTYLFIAGTRLPFLKLDRPGGALLGAVLMVVLRGGHPRRGLRTTAPIRRSTPSTSTPWCCCWG